MYVVLSKWEFDAEHESQVREAARKMMAEINSWNGVEFSYNVAAGENYVISVIGYSDREVYDRLINDPGGPFEKAAAEHGIEKNARWVWSERGEMVEP